MKQKFLKLLRLVLVFVPILLFGYIGYSLFVGSVYYCFALNSDYSVWFPYYGCGVTAILGFEFLCAAIYLFFKFVFEKRNSRRRADPNDRKDN